MGVKHHGVCVECSKQTQNAESKNREVGVKHHGVCVEHLKKKTQNSITNPLRLPFNCNKYYIAIE